MKMCLGSCRVKITNVTNGMLKIALAIYCDVNLTPSALIAAPSTLKWYRK